MLYTFGHRTVTAAQAKRLLTQAADTLAKSSVDIDRSAASLVRSRWQAVAARPDLFLEVVDRATMVKLTA